MSAVILDGRIASAEIENSLKKEIINFKTKFFTPTLAVILVGSDKPSQTYVNLKHKKCLELSIASEIFKLDDDITESDLLNLINDLNNNPRINGILVQLPLPKHLNTSKIINYISPNKDVDGFHPLNIGKLALGCPVFAPCTPLGVLKLLEFYNISVRGKNAVIIGCSNVVGKPMGLLLQFCETATCTICHILTKDITEHLLKADLIISAVGIVNLVKADMIKPGAIVIDVGFNVIETQDKHSGELIRKISGDVDFENVSKIAGYITPVPGGVGPMTIAMLMHNTLLAAKLQVNKNNFCCNSEFKI